MSTAAKKLSSMDASFLYLETPETPMHVGSMAIFRPRDGYEGDFFEDFKRTIAERLHLAPILKSRLAETPLHIDHPSLDKEVRILRARVPGASERLTAEIGRFVQSLRRRQLLRTPGVAESIDWALALSRLHCDQLDLAAVQATLGCVIKDRRDLHELAPEELSRLLEEAQAS